MKKIIFLILSVLMLTSALTLFANAAGDLSGITMERTETKGVSHPVGYYTAEKRFEKMPITFEAWVYIPQSVYSERGGIIIGNYQSFSKDDFVNFEIHTNGVPRLLIDDPSGTMHDYKFTKAVVPADKWTHVAIVYGTGTRGQQIYCYINGEFKQASSVENWFKANPEAMTIPFALQATTAHSTSKASAALLATFGSIPMCAVIAIFSQITRTAPIFRMPILCSSTSFPKLNQKLTFPMQAAMATI